MNAPLSASFGRTTASDAGAFVMVTPSYRNDFERCRLLCESVDLKTTGLSHHYILVEHRDVAQFRQLEGPRRTVVDERDLLPAWLHAFSDSIGSHGRSIWLSLRTMPLRGWHVQQLRRIAIAGRVDAETLIYVDSDVVFVRSFDFGAFRAGGRTRLFRRDDALDRPDLELQRGWSRHAGRTLGLTGDTRHDYISTLIAWDRRTVVAMCEHIERTHGRHWVEAIASSRRFSECMIYGRYVDEVRGGAGHFHSGEELCRVHWTGEPMSDQEFRRFVAEMAPHQIAVGMQSFIGTDLDRIRRLAV